MSERAGHRSAAVSLYLESISLTPQDLMLLETAGLVDLDEPMALKTANT